MPQKQHLSKDSASEPAALDPTNAAKDFGSNGAAQERLRTQGIGLSSGHSGPGMTGPVGQMWRWEFERGPVKLESNVGRAHLEGALGNQRDPRGRQHPSVGLSMGGAIVDGQITVGSEENNARLGASVGWGFGASSTITDVDNDGVPERNIDISIGPFSIGWTTEDLMSVITPERYMYLRHQAETEVQAKLGTIVDGDVAARMVRDRLKVLIDEAVQRTGTKY